MINEIDDKQNAVIVGSGISGLTAALMLKEKFANVYLVERENDFGGLLRSVKSENGEIFDYGTHVAHQTANPELNDLLFGNLDFSEWNKIEALRAGNFFGGCLNEFSPFIDVRNLPKEVYQKGLEEFLSLPKSEANYVNLAQQLTALFGKTFSKSVFSPVIEKLFGTTADSLTPDAHKLFGLSRIIALTPEKSRELKQADFFDARLGFHCPEDAPPALLSYYPKRKGIELWVNALLEQARKAGVTLYNNETIESLQIIDQKIETVALKNGNSINCDLLVWTIPPAILLKTIGIDVPGTMPKLRTVSLHHFSLDRPLLSKLHYFSCLDSKLKTFRVTLYPNLREQQSAQSSTLTVELLHGDANEASATSYKQMIFEELKQMSIIAKETQILDYQSEIVRAGFPVLTPEYLADKQAQITAVENNIKNAMLLGKAASKSFFMTDVLNETFEKCSLI